MVAPLPRAESGISRVFAGWLLASLVILPAPRLLAASSTPTVADEDVIVERFGSRFTVDVVIHAPVPPGSAWAVLTDFEHMAEFVPNLESSEILERNDALLRIKQSGNARFGPFTVRFDTLREIQLFPEHEIRARGLSGSFKEMKSVMQLEPEAGGTRLRYHAEVRPDFWLPPLLGPSLVRHETAEQFTAILQEMQRRH